MNKPQSYVSFDTNAYRYLTRNISYADVKSVVNELVRAEEAIGFQALASPIVAMELTPYLENQSGPSYQIGYCGLAAMAAHCGSGTEAAWQIRMLSDPDAMICNVLFGRVPESNNLNTEALARLCADAYRRMDGTLSNESQKTAMMYAKFVEETEQGFLEDMLKVVQIISPETKSWSEIKVSQAKKKKIANQLKSESFRIGVASMLVVKACGQLAVA
jgi:hypothetical protein